MTSRNKNDGMSTNSVIRMQSRVTRNVSLLAGRMRSFIDVENNLEEIEDKISSLNRSVILRQSMPDDLISTVSLLDSYSFYIKRKSELLRDIDAASANIAGSLSFLIDVCFENRDSNLKIWIRDCITDLNEIREIEVRGRYRKPLPLPTVSGLLIPYLETTRQGENAAWFASVRNAIRSIIS